MDDETRRVTRLENELAETRVELSETIGAIQERLTPSALAATATERVRTSAFADGVRANMLPISAVAAGAAAAWLFARRRAHTDHARHCHACGAAI